MPQTPPNQRMGELHEEDLARGFGGRKTRGSGNQWHDQGDGRNNHEDPYGFCWDGKSTRSKSLTITLAMIEKLREEAQGEHPAFGLRWYGNDALTEILEDWIVVTLADWEDILLAARAWAALQAHLGGNVSAASVLELLARAGELEGQHDRLQQDLAQAHQELGEARLLLAEARSAQNGDGRLVEEVLANADEAADGGDDAAEALAVRYVRRLEAERDRYRELATGTQEGRMIPPTVPRLPWTVVHQIHLPGRKETSGVYYDGDGHMRSFTVDEVRVERSPDSLNRPRLIVNQVRVPDGDLYSDGLLVARVCGAIRSLEVG